MAEVEMNRTFFVGASVVLGLSTAQTQVLPPNYIREGEAMLADSFLVVSEPMKTILLNFINEHDCSKCYVELFVDRQTPEITVFTVKSRDINLGYIKSQPRASLLVNIRGITVHVYSGVEGYLHGLNPRFERITPSTWHDCESVVLSVKDSMGVITKGGFGYPWGPFYPEVEIVPRIDSARVR
jgi:hypothetical protein